MNTLDIKLNHPDDGTNLFGSQEKNLKYLEEALGVTIHLRSELVQVVSDSDEKNELTRLILQALLVLISRGQTINTPDVVTAFTMAKNGEINKFIALYEEEITKDSNAKPIRVKTLGQKIYVDDILHHDITFGIGEVIHLENMYN